MKFFLLILLSGFSSYTGEPAPIDTKGKETGALYYKLHQLTVTCMSILYGHQYATEYGSGWSGDPYSD